MFESITKTATLIPIVAAIYFTFRGLLGLGMTLELVIILTMLFASLSWLLSQSIMRYISVIKHRVMAVVVVGLGTAFLITEASLTHIGLEWLLKQGSLTAPATAVWFFAISLSLTNVFAKWAYLSPMIKNGSSMENERSASKVIRFDSRDERTLEQIASQVVPPESI